jgi:hypothetical protein
VVDSFGDSRDAKSANPSVVEPARRFAVVRHPEESTDTEALLGEEASFEALSSRIATLELQLREQLEIERMRDLELHQLETELEQKSNRLQAVDDALFHERRRSAELERRWNVLAASYEQTASSLVETGATLAMIHSQRSYRLAVRVLRLFGRHRSTTAILNRLERSSSEGTTD